MARTMHSENSSTAFQKQHHQGVNMSEPQAGHNNQLKSIVDRIEHLDGEIKELRADQKDVYTEAKGHGYDVKALRRVIAFRRQDPNKREEQETLFETYMHALGAER
jgi:uncharacterized protein (UPF0335 family)